MYASSHKSQALHKRFAGLADDFADEAIHVQLSEGENTLYLIAPVASTALPLAADRVARQRTSKEVLEVVGKYFPKIQLGATPDNPLGSARKGFAEVVDHGHGVYEVCMPLPMANQLSAEKALIALERFAPKAMRSAREIEKLDKDRFGKFIRAASLQNSLNPRSLEEELAQARAAIALDVGSPKVEQMPLF